MSFLRVAAAPALVVALVVACGGVQGSGASQADRHARRVAPALCPATIAPSVAACPAQDVPAGDGNGGGCSSDADCKGPHGTDGRCIRNPALRGRGERPMNNLFAEPPPPPARSICVYDACHADSDCGPASKCICGTGRGDHRNRCVPLDRCREDHDCGVGNVCLCGANGNSNYCVEGNCHEDADCDEGFTCDERHCHSKKDTCRTNAECPPTSAGPRTCRWGRETRRFDCYVVPPIPPG